MDDIQYYLKEIAKDLLSLKSANRMTKQDQQVIENIILITIPKLQKQPHNAKD